MKNLALQALGYFAIGFILLCGLKAADHIIPDPVRAPHKIEILDCHGGELPE